MIEATFRRADVAVLAVYLTGIVGFGLWFGRRRPDAEQFMTAGGKLPGWAVGLSMFGSYVSSISFLANPGKSFGGNWNAFVFNLVTPLAVWIAVLWFLPFYRRSGEASAYAHLEGRFGPWARTYAVVCFLLTQLGRMGTILYLLAVAVRPLTGWSIPTIILGTGVLMTVTTLLGGVRAVVWTGVAQSVVLVAGTLVALGAVILAVPGGPAHIVRSGDFGLGTLDPDWTTSSFWVVAAYGLVTHLQNFGTDQSYVQRYVTARSDRDAARSLWLVPILYIPVAAMFFFIGTGLSVFYGGRRAELPPGLKSDDVFPHFIATQLPPGLAGLVVAAVFAAAMDANLNSMATLTLRDLYQRYLRPTAGDRESLLVLRAAMVVWGILSTGVALAMMHVKSALDAWWQYAAIFSGGVLGLFLLGRISKRADNRSAIAGVALGLVIIAWMTVSPKWNTCRSPFHGFLILVLGTIAVLGGGWVISRFRPAPRAT